MNPEIHLTPQEKEVLKALSEGLSRKEIASRMELSVRTIELYTDRLRGKFHCKTVFQLGYQLGLQYSEPIEPGTVAHTVSKLLKAWLLHNEKAAGTGNGIGQRAKKAS